MAATKLCDAPTKLCDAPTKLCDAPVSLTTTLKVQGDGTPRVAEIPKFALINSDEVQPAMEAYMKAVTEEFEATEIMADTLDLAQVLESASLDDDMDIAWGAVQHLLAVKNTDELRDAVNAVKPKMTELGLKMSQSEVMYRTYERVLADAPEGSPERRALEIFIRGMKLSGVGLPEAESKRFNEISVELSKLTTDFSNIALDATKKYTKVVLDKDVLKGIPQDYLSLFAEKSRLDGNADATAEAGPWTLSVDMNAYIPVMKLAENRSLREEVFKARSVVAGSSYGELSNVENINKILALRLENAKILGYKNHAEVSCAAKMATVDKARDLLEDLLSKSLPLAKKEQEELQAFAKSHGFTGTLEPWDVTFWAEKEREAKYDFNEEALKPYFVLENVFDGLFVLLKDLFGVETESFEIPKDASWDPMVRMFEMKTEGITRSFVIVDPIARPAEKRAGAWMNVVCQRSQFKGDRIPTAHVVLNCTPGTDGKPTLLTWRDVETVFHEFGHAMQHMMTQVKLPSVSGIGGVEWDVVELPSQFMENWVMQYDVLKTFAKHYETGEVLPKELHQKLEAAKNFRAATFVTRQLRFGLVDLILHSEFEGEKSFFDVDREIFERTNVLPYQEGDSFLCTFQHIFAGGYAAGYFSYLWAEVLSADAFAAFEEAGLTDEAKRQELGARFLNTILGLGGSVNPEDVYHRFRGKPVTVDALLRHKGLVA